MLKGIYKAALLATLAVTGSGYIYAYDGGVGSGGWYSGLMLGPTSSGASSSSSNSKTSVGARLFLGWEANPFFSYEGGLSTYPQSINSEGCTSKNQRKLYFDLLLKASMPVGQGSAIFTKLGAATNIYVPGLDSCKDNSTGTKFYPAISLGAGLPVSDGLNIDVSWNRFIFGGTIKNIDFYALGFYYRFG